MYSAATVFLVNLLTHIVEVYEFYIIIIIII